jgi:hypothetical protein
VLCLKGREFSITGRNISCGLRNVISNFSSRIRHNDGGSVPGRGGTTAQQGSRAGGARPFLKRTFPRRERSARGIPPRIFLNRFRRARPFPKRTFPRLEGSARGTLPSFPKLILGNLFAFSGNTYSRMDRKTIERESRRAAQWKKTRRQGLLPLLHLPLERGGLAWRAQPTLQLRRPSLVRRAGKKGFP